MLRSSLDRSCGALLDIVFDTVSLGYHTVSSMIPIRSDQMGARKYLLCQDVKFPQRLMESKD